MVLETILNSKIVRWVFAGVIAAANYFCFLRQDFASLPKLA